MKILLTILIPFFSLSLMTDSKESELDNTNLSTNERKEIIDHLVKAEADFAGAHCFCRIGFDKGDQLKEYSGAIHDLGAIKKYRNPVTRKKEDNCSRECSKKASQWYNKFSDDQLCAKFKKQGKNDIRAYSKVGTRKWTVCQTFKSINCCNTRTLTCPDGTSSEDKNFPGMCSQYYCVVPGDQRMYNKDGSPWGFVYKGRLHKLVRGKISSSGWKSCN